MLEQINQDLIDKYETFLSLKKELDTLYHYRFAIYKHSNGIEWVEACDKLSDILMKIKVVHVEKVELLGKE